jgi:hypothetical protein
VSPKRARSPLRIRRSIAGVTAAFPAVCLVAAWPTGSAWADTDPPTGVYVCYDEITILTGPVANSPVPDRLSIPVPAGAYTEEPPC